MMKIMILVVVRMIKIMMVVVVVRMIKIHNDTGGGENDIIMTKI